MTHCVMLQLWACLVIASSLVLSGCDSSLDSPESVPLHCRPFEITQPEECADYTQYIEARSHWVVEAGDPTGLSYAALSRFIQDCRISTMDELLPKLPLDYRRGYTFMHTTRSRQGASPEKPRAIVFGQNADFILTYNDDPALAANQDLEVMEWLPLESRFVAHVIRFPGPLSDISDLAPAPGSFDSTDCGSLGLEHSPVTPVAQPQVCAGCHAEGSQDPYAFRPKWDSYNLWPGAYGSLSRNGMDMMHPEQLEYAHYRSFMENARFQGRYLPLVLREENYITRVGSLDIPVSSNGLVQDYTGRGANDFLQLKLMEKNQLRIAEQITRHPEFERLKYAWLAYSIGCVDVCIDAPTAACAGRYRLSTGSGLPPESFVPTITGTRTFADLFVRVDQEVRAERELLKERLVGWNELWLISSSMHFEPYTSEAGGFEFQREAVLLKILADRMEDGMFDRWSMGVEGARYDFFTSSGSVAMESLANRIFERILEVPDPELIAFQSEIQLQSFRPRIERSSSVCSRLAELSRAQLAL
jgi:hypothetical protein